MGLFQHWVMVGGSSPEADRLGLRLSEEETKHGVFCRPGCLDGRDAPVCRDPKRRCYARGKGAVYSCQHCGRTGSSSGLPEDPVRNGPDGADALSRFEPAWITRRLRREPAGLSGAEVASNAQDRPQRCPRLGASRPYRLLQTRLREVAAGTRCPLADHRPQEAGRPAGHSREPDPRSCRGVRRPAATCAEPSLYQAGAAGQRGHRWFVCCDAVLRRNGTLPYDWLTDEGRAPRQPYMVEGIVEALNNARRHYRKDPWQHKDELVQIWIEKNALAGVIEPVTREYGVALMVTVGYSSITFAYKAAQTIDTFPGPVHIYHFGDYDPSGQDAARALEEELRLHAPGAD